jgi:hypothetical protein
MVYQSILFHYMPPDAIMYHYQTIHCVYSSFFHLHNVACAAQKHSSWDAKGIASCQTPQTS